MSQPLGCKWKDCKITGKKFGFCGLHEARGLLLKAAEEKGVRICDDGKRSCRNETFNKKLKCEECLKQTRIKENKNYNERITSTNLCITCGCVLEVLAKGITGAIIQKCERCYTNHRKAEETRKERQRNYATEKMLNPLRHFREYTDSAAKRNIQFDLSFDEFSELVKQPCTYCNAFNETEVIGIDRIDSFQGYSSDNTVACCGCCNSMKQQLTQLEFANHIEKIYTTFARTFVEDDSSNSSDTKSSPSYKLRPRHIVSLYSKKQLSNYIELCKLDKRAATYIQKMLDATTYTMTSSEFRNYLENAARTEIRSQELTNTNERNRVPRKEIICLLDSNKPEDVVKLYESVFGPTKDIMDDMKSLASIWKTEEIDVKMKQLDTCFTKYNNARAYKKRLGLETIQTPLQSVPFILETPDNITNTIDVPKQWKVSNIYTHIQCGDTASYLSYIKENNPTNTTIEDMFTSLLRDIKEMTRENAEVRIQAFIDELRTQRHTLACFKKNVKILDRDDREQWPSSSVLRAFNEGKIDTFKKFTEDKNNEDSNNPSWVKRWDTFIKSMQTSITDTEKIEKIGNFLRALRTKKYRASLKEKESPSTSG
jgi:hypothetical protein